MFKCVIWLFFFLMVVIFLSWDFFGCYCYRKEFFEIEIVMKVFGNFCLFILFVKLNSLLGKLIIVIFCCCFFIFWVVFCMYKFNWLVSLFEGVVGGVCL